MGRTPIGPFRRRSLDRRCELAIDFLGERLSGAVDLAAEGVFRSRLTMKRAADVPTHCGLGAELPVPSRGVAPFSPLWRLRVGVADWRNGSATKPRLTLWRFGFAPFGRGLRVWPLSRNSTPDRPALGAGRRLEEPGAGMKTIVALGTAVLLRLQYQPAAVKWRDGRVGAQVLGNTPSHGRKVRYSRLEMRQPPYWVGGIAG